MTAEQLQPLSASRAQLDLELVEQTSPNLLLIDDTPENLRLLVEILLRKGYQVRPVTDGALAIAAAQLHPPDLILLDVKMPQPDGYEVCKTLKADPKTRDIPIIFLTVLDDPSDQAKGFEAGGVDYIVKPFEVLELLARVDNQLNLVRLRKQLVAKEQFLRTVYDGLEAAVSVIDVLENGKFCIVGVNDCFVRMSGIPRASLEGADLAMFVPQEKIKNHHQLAVDTVRAHTVEESLLLHGEETWWLATHTPLVDEQGRVYRLIGTSLNITQRKQVELNLAEQQEQLRQTLGDLKETQSQLVESTKLAALGNLVAGIAHEINTPLGVAITAASTLESELRQLLVLCGDQSPDMTLFQDYLELIEECSGLVLGNLARAGELVQSFKQVSVDQVSVRDRTFTVMPYLEEVILNLKPQLKATPHRIELTGDEDCAIHSCPGALSQVITNLVLNSLDHGFVEAAKPGLIQLKVQQDNDRCRLCYQDNGVGISPDNIGRIFEPFFTTARQTGGSGLGLHVVYNLVTQPLQGEITVTSEPGQGVKFAISLPRELAMQEPGDR